MVGVGVHPGGYIGDRDACLGGRLRGARDGDEAGLALDEQVVRLLVPVRARGAVARDAADDEAGVPLQQLLRTEAEPPRYARREVLDENVGSFEQTVEDPAGALLFEV
jgi:hypothetical protein